MRGDDATIRIKPPAPPRQRHLLPAVVAGGAALLLCGAIAAWMLSTRPGAPLPAPPQAIAPPPAAAVPAEPFRIETADEATILGHVAEHLTVYRFAPNPKIIVLDFPSLRMQGEMLNRIASLIEKAGLPRNQVLTDAALESAIREHGDTAETYYYGHDYRADELAFFFATADRQSVAPDAEEERLRVLLRQLGWLDPGATGALISVPRTGPTITETMRAAMLHHELSHGEFFSNPQYASYVHDFWLNVVTEAERAAVRHFLGSMDYDTDNEELMYNEMQAYVMFTYDQRFFLPSNVNMTPARRLQLQTEFLKGMPDCWLKAALAQHLQPGGK
ncbi:MAG TPA: hypothetical protein VFE41_09510 [Acetobacteraceae bacterium]|jgi:hypothetical protein|nr:hypothetical protein [Acetobacteraceae bacterium]